MPHNPDDPSSQKKENFRNNNMCSPPTCSGTLKHQTKTMTVSSRRLPLSIANITSVYPCEENEAATKPRSSTFSPTKSFASPKLDICIRPPSSRKSELQSDKPNCTSIDVEENDKIPQQPVQDSFRSTEWVQPVSDDEQEDLWTLKRANPIYDEDDDDDDEEFTQYQSPTKRSKTLSLHWENKLPSNDIPALVSVSDDD